MLTEQERLEIEEEIKQLPHKQAACIEALRIVQEHRGWVSDESICDISDILEMTPEEVDGVATFYNLVFRKPVGRHVILVCDSISCWVMGYEQILQSLSGLLGIKFGETTADGRFTLLPIPCLGTCDRAPALMIDDDLHHNISVGKLERILEKYE